MGSTSSEVKNCGVDTNSEEKTDTRDDILDLWTKSDSQLKQPPMKRAGVSYRFLLTFRPIFSDVGVNVLQYQKQFNVTACDA